MEYERTEVIRQTFNSWDRIVPQVVRKSNCADKTVVTEFLLIVACMGSGQIEVILRDGEFKTRVYEQQRALSDSITGEDLVFIENFDLSISQTYIFWTERSLERPPQVHCLEVLVNTNKDSFNTVTFKHLNFGSHLKEDKSNYGKSINVGAGGNLLIINWLNFESMQVYLICGFRKSINVFKQKECLQNPQDVDKNSPTFTLGLPNYNVY